MRPPTEANLMADFLQGALTMHAGVFVTNPAGPIRQPAHVDQPIDAQGDYEPFFRIKLASGAVIRVEVYVEKEVDSEQGG